MLELIKDVPENLQHPILASTEVFIGVIPEVTTHSTGAGSDSIAILNATNASIKKGVLSKEGSLDTVYMLCQNGDQVSITKDQLELIYKSISEIS